MPGGALLWNRLSVQRPTSGRISTCDNARVHPSGLLVLWTVCNWTTSALLEGEGSIRELWIASCYATLPYLVIVLPLTGLSGVFTLSEAVFLNTGLAIAQGWMLVLLFCGTMITQQFTVSRTIVCVLLTILLMLGVVFLLLLFFTIFQQMAGFVSTVFAGTNPSGITGAGG